MNKYVYFLLLIVVSLIVCIVTFMLLAGGAFADVAANFAVNFPSCLLLCVIYYKVMSHLRRVPFLRNNQSLRIVCDWLCAMAAGVVGLLVIRCVVDVNDDWHTQLMTFVLWNSLAVFGMELYFYNRSVLEKETQLARMEREKAAYQFEMLKQQLNPHFLFNSLNVLAALAYQDAEKANLFAKKLSGVYRYLLQTAGKQLVTLGEEMSFLTTYLYLEKIRFDRTLQVITDIPDVMLSLKIVPVSLQILVENALKHNIATEEKPLRIFVKAADNKIIVENNLQLRNEVAASGVGLQNLQRQYAALGNTITVCKSSSAFSVTLPLIR